MSTSAGDPVQNALHAGGQSKRCPLCGADAALEPEHVAGYQQPLVFDVYACPRCESKFVEPLQSFPAVYDLIYADLEHVRGYARYARYARSITSKRDPLAYLADEEDAYWAIASCLEANPKGRHARIIEIGSGLGYLTYAISRRGYDVRGVDISNVAVRKARERFGALYERGDIFSLPASHEAAFDMVIMTELIEHIPNLIDFVAAAVRLLRPGGELVLTTPNRFASPPDALWDTDLPPVHLWWLSERSVLQIGERLGMAVRFVDFSEFNRSHDTLAPGTFVVGSAKQEPVFDANGRMLARSHPLRPLARRLAFGLGLGAYRRANQRRRAGKQGPEGRRPTLCAILTRSR
jgi:SAM-dependent methyltransferase